MYIWSGFYDAVWPRIMQIVILDVTSFEYCHICAQLDKHRKQQQEQNIKWLCKRKKAEKATKNDVEGSDETI